MVAHTNINSKLIKKFSKIKFFNTRVVILMLLILFVLSCNKLNTEPNIYGNWEGNYQGHELSFVFKKDSTCIYTYFDKKSNKFKTINGNYELDYTKTPIPLSIRNIPQLNHPLFTIVEFIRDDSIRIAKFSPKWRLRPISFVTENVINLRNTTNN